MMHRLIALLVLSALSCTNAAARDKEVVHDAEYYVLEAQNGERWAVEDGKLDQKLEELAEKNGAPPNIIHIMWDDTSFGDVGIPAISKIRGFESPNIDRMAEEGVLFTRMYTEVGCTPSRSAVMTGRLAVRSATYDIGFPIHNEGLNRKEVTMAEVLSEVGYSTAFYGKWHLGDIEESYPHNQGFDETLFTPYNQVTSIQNATGEGANAVLGLVEEMLPPDPYKLDDTILPKGWVQAIEGEKGEPGREWKKPDLEGFLEIDPECHRRTLAFIEKNAEAKKPFYVAYWPNMTAFIPNPKKVTQSRSLYADGFTQNVDAFIGKVMDRLRELGIAENTILVTMADNGPMAHNPPPGLGMTETIFRGGKGDFLEGGVRVPAFAWWPGTIEGGQIVGDIIHETDLYTTFARLAGAKKHIPSDRIVDGIDQTALFINGDTHGRRDSVFIYAGPRLGAIVKGNFKKHVISSDPTAGSGIAASYYFLLHDTREKSPMLVNTLHLKGAFNRMQARHELWKEKYPDWPATRGPALTGIANARPETKALSKAPVNMKDLPFDPLQYIKYDPPFDRNADPDLGD
ncbi:MAG: sulfatase-like hydrolase/transferase [Deltaproteobacteria bacterium]|nr:sulfatase-like hydrolase/transferase [Deltaproteobacteria bacterium]MBT8463862.1 sulfatase-like hydrolase/transferase [Deltaproteobacteria bacterium]NNK06112.1 sulfatase-like hydrolase/transferase [Myxococcales bacterium]